MLCKVLVFLVGGFIVKVKIWICKKLEILYYMDWVCKEIFIL